MSREELQSASYESNASTREQIIAALQQTDDFISTLQQILDGYSNYQKYTLSCNALTPLTTRQLQLLAMGIADKSTTGLSAFLCYFLTSGDTELLTLSEYGILLTVLSLQ